MSSTDVALALDLPVDQVGAQLLKLPEDQWFDRKSFRVSPKKLADAEVGMANADGGVLVVGLSEGRIEGTDRDPRHRNRLVQAAINLCVPPVRTTHRLVPCVNAESHADHLLVLEIGPSDLVHANTGEEVFLRVGDANRKLTFQQRQELLYDKGQASYEGQPLPGTTFSDVDEGLVADYTARVGHPNPSRLLTARGLTRENQLSVAGYLLFAELPQQRFPSAHVRVSRFQGRERGLGARQRLLDDVRVEGPIPRLLPLARDEIRRLQPTRRALTRAGTFEDVPLVPEDAWLEGLVNAVVHRSYSIAGDHIHVDVFDDRIEVESPGRFPGLVNLDDPLHATRFARNPRIARVCADLRFGQEFGEGIPRMFEEMRLAGLGEPVYRQTAGSVRLVLSGEPRGRGLDAGSPEGASVVVRALREAGSLNTGELADVMGLSRPTALRRLRALRDAGVIEWVGKSSRDPHAYWRLAGPRYGRK